MRVLESVKQVSGSGWVIAVAAADVLIETDPGVRGALLRDPVHGVEGIVGNHLAVGTIDLLSSPGCVIGDVGSLAGPDSDLVWPVPLIVKRVDVVVTERIAYPVHIPNAVVGEAGYSFVGSARRFGHRTPPPVIIVLRLNPLRGRRTWKLYPGYVGIREAVIVSCTICIVVKVGRVNAVIPRTAHGRGGAPQAPISIIGVAGDVI